MVGLRFRPLSLNEKPGFCRAFLIAVFSIAGWGKLVRTVHIVYFVIVRWFWSLIRKTGRRQKRRFGFGGGMGGEAGFSAPQLAKARAQPQRASALVGDPVRSGRKTKYRDLSTAAAKCAAFGRDD